MDVLVFPPNMDSPPFTEVVMRTLVPLIVTYMPAVLTVIVAWITLIQFYFGRRKDSGVIKKYEAPVQNITRKPIEASIIENGNKKQSPETWRQESPRSFSHDWLLEHTDNIINDFSSNDDFHTSCADEDLSGASGSSSGSEANKENSPGRLSRRQKKNRGRKEEKSPMKKKVKRSQKKMGTSGQCPLKHTLNLKLNDADIYFSLQRYTLQPNELYTLGYPIECNKFPGCAVIYKVPKIDTFDTKYISSYPEDKSIFIPLTAINEFKKTKQTINKPSHSSKERKCVRCSKVFLMTNKGEYLTEEVCVYHWGKFRQPPSGAKESVYSCCKKGERSKGCASGQRHVWTGVEEGLNGPLAGYVRTRPKKSIPLDGNYGVYSLDCEMCFTNTGLDLTKITVVGLDGKLVYESFVRPDTNVVDYNTRFSGITSKDMYGKVKSLKEVQNDLMGFISADTILVGHGLENDLRALKLIHYYIVDTAVVFPHYMGLPFKRSLKALSKVFLYKTIQTGAHDSYEDACSCLELVLKKLRMDQYVSSNQFEEERSRKVY